jgi:hypothetical protein
MKTDGEQGSRSMQIRSRKEPCASIRFALLHRNVLMRGRATMNRNAIVCGPAAASEAG